MDSTRVVLSPRPDFTSLGTACRAATPVHGFFNGLYRSHVVTHVIWVQSSSVCWFQTTMLSTGTFSPLLAPRASRGHTISWSEMVQPYIRSDQYWQYVCFESSDVSGTCSLVYDSSSLDTDNVRVVTDSELGQCNTNRFYYILEHGQLRQSARSGVRLSKL